MSTDVIPTLPTPNSRARRVAIGFAILVAVLVVYVLSLIGVHLLSKSSPPLPAVDLGQFHKEDTIVQLSLEELKPVANRLSVNVLVYPEDNLYDENMGVLTSDAAVRLYPDNDLGDLQYPKGKAPAQVSTKIEAHGDPGNLPFDTYTTGELSASVFTGGYHDKVWARMEVTGSLDGWDVSVKRVHACARRPRSQRSSDSSASPASSTRPMEVQNAGRRAPMLKVMVITLRTATRCTYTMSYSSSTASEHDSSMVRVTSSMNGCASIATVGVGVENCVFK